MTSSSRYAGREKAKRARAATWERVPRGGGWEHGVEGGRGGEAEPRPNLGFRINLPDEVLLLSLV